MSGQDVTIEQTIAEQVVVGGATSDVTLLQGRPDVVLQGPGTNDVVLDCVVTDESAAGELTVDGAPVIQPQVIQEISEITIAQTTASETILNGVAAPNIGGFPRLCRTLSADLTVPTDKSLIATRLLIADGADLFLSGTGELLLL